MLHFIIQVMLTMIVQLALLFRLITGQYMLNVVTNPFRKTKYHLDVEELLSIHDDNEVSIQPLHPNHESTENVVNLSNVPSPPVGIIGFIKRGYVFHKKEEEEKYDMKFIETSKMFDIFMEWKETEGKMIIRSKNTHFFNLIAFRIRVRLKNALA